jgi:DNA-binding NarL/FixJ family response regulator
LISVAVIEDNRLVREGIASLLNNTKDFRVVAAASNGDPALLRAANPDVSTSAFATTTA